MNIRKYDSLDGLRAYAATGIVLMHVYANGKFHIEQISIAHIISLFTCFVFLFMIISSFSMCCGYYEKFKSGVIDIESFYKRRYSKIWPFFSFLVFLGIFTNFSMNSIIEGFADLTLVYSLLPNSNISVIGIAWTLGVIFVFYLLFPFFVFIISNKRRAWFCFGISVMWNIVCELYFFDTNHVIASFSPRTNILYCAQYFLAGGIIYLYRERLIFFVTNNKLMSLSVTILASIAYYYIDYIGDSGWYEITRNLSMLILFSIWIIFAISSKSVFLSNRILKFISSISMEIYLCHMVIFRFLEKSGLLSKLNKGEIGYLICFILVFCGAIIFSVFFRKAFDYIKKNIVSLR